MHAVAYRTVYSSYFYRAMSILLLVMNIRRGNRIGSITAAQKSLYSTNRIITRIQLVTSLRTSRYNGDVTSSRIGLGRPVSRLLSTSTTTSNFYNDSEEDIKLLLKEWGQPAFRAQQIHSWVFEKGVTDFDDMLDLPKDLRSKLKLFYAVGSLKLISEQVSKDGTRKRAYELKDGQIIESVLMPYDDGRRTACISSQAGCGMGCVFCATGQMGFSRQLTSAEIFEQAQIYSTELKKTNERLSNIVFMGMGEPLANYDNVLSAVRRLNTDLGIGIRHITISTVGLAPRIRKLAEENLQVGLAVSLHQTTDAKRSALMPVNDRYNISDLLDACQYYIDKTNRRISFEWALIRDQTDTEVTAHELGKLLRGMLCHVNVIPLNPTNKFGGKPTSKAGVLRFIEILAEYGVTATPRTRRGIDIDAGCGQLKADLLRKKKMMVEMSTGSPSSDNDGGIDGGDDDDGGGNVLSKVGRRNSEQDNVGNRDRSSESVIALTSGSSKDQRLKDIEVLLKSMD